MGHYRSLEYQLRRSIEEAWSPGQSKRSWMRSHGGRTGARIFGSEHKAALLNFGVSLVRWVREHTGARLLADIKAADVQAWLDSRGAVAATTARTYTAYVHKLAAVVRECYPSASCDWGAAVVPVDAGRARARTAEGMDAAALEALQERLEASSSPNAARGLAFARVTGARAEEASTWVYHPDKVTYAGGRWGFGTVTFDGRDGCKGGRPRTVSLQSPEDAAILRGLVATMQPGQSVTTYGGRRPGQSLDRAISRALGAESGQIGIHAVRKAWAQRAYNFAYDAARDAGTAPGAADREACGVCMSELGHSEDRRDDRTAYIGARRSD